MSSVVLKKLKMYLKNGSFLLSIRAPSLKVRTAPKLWGKVFWATYHKTPRIWGPDTLEAPISAVDHSESVKTTPSTCGPLLDWFRPTFGLVLDGLGRTEGCETCGHREKNNV